MCTSITVDFVELEHISTIVRAMIDWMSNYFDENKSDIHEFLLLRSRFFISTIGGITVSWPKKYAILKSQGVLLKEHVVARL
jgi:hypothetical protein